jgi:hypothetical protein
MPYATPYSEALDEEAARLEAQARQDIRDAFAVITKMPAKLIALPYVTSKNGQLRVASMSMDKAAVDLLGEGECQPELLAVLKDSQCPLVQALRDAMCKQWEDSNAYQIAEVSL